MKRRADKPLTASQRRALKLTERKGGATIGTDSNQISAYMAALFDQRGWTTGRDVRVITKAGRAKLHAPLPEGPPIYLASGGGVTYRTLPNGRQVVDDNAADSTLTDHGYTTSRARAADDLETMDPGKLHTDWAQRAHAHHRAAMAATDAARLSGLTTEDERIAELKRMAAERGQDIRGDLRQLEHVIGRIERKVRRDEAA